jgi:predicted metalloendopeptidase
MTAKEKAETGNDAPNTEYVLANLHWTEAKKIVLETEDVSLLKKWETEETRTAISTYITNRIKELEEKLKPKGE